MPASSKIDWLDYLRDFSDYYRMCVLTHNGTPAIVMSADESNGVAVAGIRHLVTSPKLTWGENVFVPIDELDFTVPRMGIFKVGQAVVQLSRKPQRAKLKGFCDSLVEITVHGNIPDYFPALFPTHPMVVDAVWNRGKSSRFSDRVVVREGQVFYLDFPVALIDQEGNIQNIEGLEKLGETTCKLLANSLGSTNFRQLLSTHLS